MTPDPRAAAWADSVSIIPISPGSKIPPMKWEEYQTRKATREERAEWREKYPGCNWALVTGVVSGIIALDFDKAKGREIRKEHNVYGGPASITPRGGFHTLHLHPGRNIPNKARLIEGEKPEDGGLDLRGDGGYIVIPPSVFEGKAYRWEVTPWTVPPTPIPGWAIELIDKASRSAAPTVTTPEAGSEADGLPAGVGEGQRNDATARVAGRYLARGLHPEEIWPILQAWNTKNKPPLPVEELRGTLSSIARKEREKSPVMDLVDSADLGRLTTHSRPKLIDPFLPAGGKIVLAGWQGSYKSTLVLNWAICLRNALPVFGRFDTAETKVLYVDRENPPELTNLRVERIARGLHGLRGGITFQFPKEKPDLADRRIREAYIRTIEKGGFGLSVFDSFLSFFNLRDENSNTEVRNALELVSEIPAKTGCAVLIIDHAAKASADRAKAGIKVTPRGASAKGDWADAVLTLEEKEDEARKLRVLRFPKTRFAVSLPAVVLEVDPLSLVMLPSGEDELCPVFTIRGVVGNHPGIRGGELYRALSSATGCSTRTAMRSTLRAVQLGYVRREEKGREVFYHPIGDKANVTNSEGQEFGGEIPLVYQ